MEPANTKPAEPKSAKPSKSWVDENFHTVVMGLMLCIVVTLAVLWFGERRRRTEAETALSEARMELVATQAILQMVPPARPFGDDEANDPPAATLP